MKGSICDLDLLSFFHLLILRGRGELGLIFQVLDLAQIDDLEAQIKYVLLYGFGTCFLSECRPGKDNKEEGY